MIFQVPSFALGKKLPPILLITLLMFAVLPCWKEPLSGWTDNFHGTNGMIALCLANGPVTFLLENTSPKYHGIPADYVINALIAGIPFSNVE